MTNPGILFSDGKVKLLNTISSLILFLAALLIVDFVPRVGAANSVLTPAWRIAVGDRPYLSADTVPTGMAYNANTDDLLLVAGSSGNRIIILDAITGNEKGRMYTDTTVISGGDSSLNVIGLTDDGTVYAANLVSDSSTANFSVYRWDNEGPVAVPSLVFSDDPSSADADADNRRFGDTMAVRGSGAQTQILVGSRNGNIVAMLTNPDGFRFFGTTIQTDAPKGAFGQGIAFGQGNSFWAKSNDGILRLFDFDMMSISATTRVAFATGQVSSNFTGIAYDSRNKLLAGVSTASPVSLRLYDLSNLAHPRIADQSAFPADNSNVNGTLATAFGNGRVYGLDSNNGLVGLTVNPTMIGIVAPAQLAVVAPNGTAKFQLTLKGSANRDYRVESTSDFISWTPVSTVTVGNDGTASVSDPISPAQVFRFYRAVNP